MIASSLTNKTIKNKVQTKRNKIFFKKTISLLLLSGAHIGHDKKILTTAMTPFVYGYRKNICILNLSKTYIQLQIAMKFIQKLKKDYHRTQMKPTIIFVGTNKKTQLITKLASNQTKQFYILNKWIPGFCSNFYQQKISILRYKIFEQKFLFYYKLLQNNQYNKAYHKYKILYTSLRHYYNGLRNTYHQPSLFIFFNPEDHFVGLQEASTSLIPSIGITDTNVDSKLFNHITYPICGNNDSLESLSFFANILSKTITAK